MDYKFRNGDIVKITTLPTAEPRHDWLRLVHSSGAKPRSAASSERSPSRSIVLGTEKSSAPLRA